MEIIVFFPVSNLKKKRYGNYVLKNAHILATMINITNNTITKRILMPTMFKSMYSGSKYGMFNGIASPGISRMITIATLCKPLCEHRKYSNNSIGCH